jgi:hypothetical protein
MRAAPICVVRSSPTPSLNTTCPLVPGAGGLPCENQGVCAPRSSPAVFPPGGATCSPAACAAQANVMQPAPPGTSAWTADRYACQTGSQTDCTCATGYSGVVCSLAAVDPRCPAGKTGVGCTTDAALLAQGACRCSADTAGPTCSIGAGGPLDVWCRGDDSSQAVAAFNHAKSVCAINADFRSASVVTTMIPPIGCTPPGRVCTSDAQCGVSTCGSGGVCIEVPPPPPAGAAACTVDADCPAGAASACVSGACMATCTADVDCPSDSACSGSGPRVCRSTVCDAALLTVVPSVPMVPLAGAACDPVMSAGTDRTVAVGPLNLASRTYTRVPFANPTSGPDRLTLRDDAAATTELAAWPVPAIDATSCTAADLMLRDAVGSTPSARSTASCAAGVAGACTPDPWGRSSDPGATPDETYAPPYPARFCGR